MSDTPISNSRKNSNTEQNTEFSDVNVTTDNQANNIVSGANSTIADAAEERLRAMHSAADNVNASLLATNHSQRQPDHTGKYLASRDLDRAFIETTRKSLELELPSVPYDRNLYNPPVLFANATPYFSNYYMKYHKEDPYDVATKGYCLQGLTDRRFYDALKLSFDDATNKNEQAQMNSEMASLYARHQSAAMKGNPEAQFKLANLYKLGVGAIEPNHKKAEYWYRRAAEQDYAPAQTHLARIYDQRPPQNAKDFNEAKTWYERAAEQGYADAEYALAKLYHWDGAEFYTPDLGQRKYWLKRAASRGHALAQVESGVFSRYQRADTDEVASWKRAARQGGDAATQYWLGLMYEYGHHMDAPNLDKARYWYRKAAKGGHAEAQYQLARFYFDGKGLDQPDFDAARIWFEAAARQGDAEAPYYLGRIYYNGFGSVDQDYNKARDFFVQADRDCTDPSIKAEAQYHLGQIYTHEFGSVARDYSKACRFYEQAISNDVHPNIKAGAFYELGRIYRRGGRGIARDYDKARSFFEQANSDSANPSIKAAAQYGLGEILFFGHGGTDQDYDNARVLFEQAAGAGAHPAIKAMAQYRLGEIHLHGYGGVNQDYDTARELYNQAAGDDANPDTRAMAQYRLGEIYHFGLGSVTQDYERSREFFEQADSDGAHPDTRAQAQFGRGDIYYHGYGGVAQDYDKARGFFEHVISVSKDRKQVALAHYYLGKIYYNGFGGVAQDYERARKLFERAGSDEADTARGKEAREMLRRMDKYGQGLVSQNARGGNPGANDPVRDVSRDDPQPSRANSGDIIDDNSARNAQNTSVPKKRKARGSISADVAALDLADQTTETTDTQVQQQSIGPADSTTDASSANVTTAPAPPRQDASQGQPEERAKELAIAWQDGDDSTQTKEQVAANDEHELHYQLYQLYRRGGDGVDADRAEAAQWLALAAQGGNESAKVALLSLEAKTSDRSVVELCLFLRDVYEGGLNEVRTDFHQAMRWLIIAQKGADEAQEFLDQIKNGNNKDLQFEVAQIFHHGAGSIDWDPDKAQEWYERAEINGHPRAVNGLKELRQKMRDMMGAIFGNRSDLKDNIRSDSSIKTIVSKGAGKNKKLKSNLNGKGRKEFNPKFITNIKIKNELNKNSRSINDIKLLSGRAAEFSSTGPNNEMTVTNSEPPLSDEPRSIEVDSGNEADHSSNENEDMGAPAVNSENLLEQDAQILAHTSHAGPSLDKLLREARAAYEVAREARPGSTKRKRAMKDALGAYQRASNAGSAEAAYELGLLHIYGVFPKTSALHTPGDENTSEGAALQTNIDRYGAREKSINIRPNPAVDIPYETIRVGLLNLHKAADLGHTYAQYELALCYFEGKVLKDEFELIRDVGKEAREQKKLDDRLNKGAEYLIKAATGQPACPQAIDALAHPELIQAKAAAPGQLAFAIAQTHPDMETANRFYIQAAAKNYAPALCHLGRTILLDQQYARKVVALAKDEIEIKDEFDDTSNDIAISSVVASSVSEAPQQRVEKALERLEKASALGHREAALVLGCYHLALDSQGQRTADTEPDMAKSYLERACANENHPGILKRFELKPKDAAEAHYRLALVYLNLMRPLAEKGELLNDGGKIREYFSAFNEHITHEHGKNHQGSEDFQRILLTNDARIPDDLFRGAADLRRS